MPQANIIAAATEVLLDARSGGTCAVYIVEARNRQEIREVKELFADLEGELDVRQLAEGTVTAYAVRVPGRDQRILDEIELSLKENYRFSIAAVQEVALQRGARSVPGQRKHAARRAHLRHLQRARPLPHHRRSPRPFGQRLAGGGTTRCCGGRSQDDRELTLRLLAADRTGLAPLESCAWPAGAGRQRLYRLPR